MGNLQAIIAVIMGVVFIVLGIGARRWGKTEEKHYYDKIVTRRRDVREYLDRTPIRPEARALVAGGWIAIIVGIFLLILGAYWFWG